MPELCVSPGEYRVGERLSFLVDPRTNRTNFTRHAWLYGELLRNQGLSSDKYSIFYSFYFNNKQRKKIQLNKKYKDKEFYLIIKISTFIRAYFTYLHYHLSRALGTRLICRYIREIDPSRIASLSISFRIKLPHLIDKLRIALYPHSIGEFEPRDSGG